MKILDNTKSLSTLVADNSNGLGQIQPLSCVVTEELNGIYELDFTVNVNDKHYNDLKNSGLVKVTVGDGSEQIFRIYKIDEPINMISSVHCQHITYDLSKVVVKPFTATGAVNIKNQLVANMLGSYPFSTWTDITNTTSTFTNDIPRYFRECLGGYEGSVLDVLRPEYEWDNLTVKLHARRGADNGVRISYGKNLIDYSQEQNNENVYDGVYGYAVVDEQEYHATTYFNKTGATYPRILNVDFSSDYESGQVPTSAELLQKATTYAQNNSIEVPSINIKIDFIPLWQTEEYKNILPLERVSLGDTVHVYFDKLNVEASSRVIKTEWNVLTNKYDSIELGDAKANLNTIINDSVSTAVDEAVSNMDIDVGYIEEDLNNLADLITNGLGLFVTRDVVIDGAERIVLHNRPTVADSNIQYYIGANGLVVSTDGGQTWNAGISAEGDAYFNALSANTIRALQIYGSFLRFGDSSTKYIDVAPFDANNDNVADGILFDGNGYVKFSPQESFVVENAVPSDTTKSYNMLRMEREATNGTDRIYLYNYNPSSLKLDNSFSMSSVVDPSDSTIKATSISMLNYDPNTESVANSLLMACGTNTNRVELINYFRGTTKKATQVFMDSSGGYSVMNLYTYNNDSSNTVRHSITMPANGNMTIHGEGDMYITSSGHMRIQTSNSQDLTISSNDDLYITARDKIYWNGTSVGFRSDGSIGAL